MENNNSALNTPINNKTNTMNNHYSRVISLTKFHADQDSSITKDKNTNNQYDNCIKSRITKRLNSDLKNNEQYEIDLKIAIENSVNDSNNCSKSISDNLIINRKSSNYYNNKTKIEILSKTNLEKKAINGKIIINFIS